MRNETCILKDEKGKAGRRAEGGNGVGVDLNRLDFVKIFTIF